MAAYRLKPLLVEATQWIKNGDHPEDYTSIDPGSETVTSAERKANDWEGRIVRRFRDPDRPGQMLCKCGFHYQHHGWIDEEAGFIVHPGDFICTLADGSHRPLNRNTFIATYDFVS